MCEWYVNGQKGAKIKTIVKKAIDPNHIQHFVVASELHQYGKHMEAMIQSS